MSIFKRFKQDSIVKIKDTKEMENSLTKEEVDKIIVGLLDLADLLKKANEKNSQRDGIVIENISKIKDVLYAQGSSVQEAKENVNELINATEDINTITSEVETKSYGNIELVSSGNDSIDQLNSQMDYVKQIFSQFVNTLQTFQKEVRSISNFAKVIEEIASETSMLALNASIEAANAGSHGKGFAVVAEQVKQLAGQSKSASQEVNAKIIDILFNVSKMSDDLKDKTKELDKAQEMTQTTRDFFVSISESETELFRSMKGIKDATDKTLEHFEAFTNKLEKIIVSNQNAERSIIDLYETSQDKYVIAADMTSFISQVKYLMEALNNNKL